MKKLIQILIILAILSNLALEQKYFLLLFGLLMWTIDLLVLHKLGISTNMVLNTTVNTNNLLDLLFITSIIAAVLYIVSLYTLHLSLLLVTGIVVLLYYKGSGFYRTEWQMFINSLNRIAFDGLNQVVTFGDVVFADVLTSFSKEIGDFKDIISIFFPLQHFFIDLVGVVLVSLPFTFRLRQTLAEYNKAKDLDEKKRHLGNALKYASSYPVIWTTFYINWSIKNKMELQSLVLWILFSTVNSLYSLYWDVFVDWKLFNYEKKYQEFGRTLYFQKYYYVGAIVFNIVVRMFWILKISLFMHQEVLLEDSSQLVFLDFSLRILEIVRRGVWVIFRFEREWVVGGYLAV